MVQCHNIPDRDGWIATNLDESLQSRGETSMLRRGNNIHVFVGSEFRLDLRKHSIAVRNKSCFPNNDSENFISELHSLF